MHLLHTLNLNILPTFQVEVTVTHGTKQKTFGKVDLLIKLNGQCRSLSILVVSTLCHSLILGNDFCKEFALVINFSNLAQIMSSPVVNSKSLKHGLVSLVYSPKTCVLANSSYSRFERKNCIFAAWRNYNIFVFWRIPRVVAGSPWSITLGRAYNQYQQISVLTPSPI